MTKEIIPAVLPHDYQELSDALAFLKGASSWVQIDLVDGEFVPGVPRTWPFSESSHFAEILGQEEGMPYWRDFQFEFDLMIARPEELVDDFIQAGAARVVFHYESTQAMNEILDKLEHSHVEAVIALSRSTTLEELDAHAQRLSAVQIMGIEEIGAQGQPFDEEALEQVRLVVERFPELTIQVDGGVDEHTIQAISEAGAHRFISGSTILSAEDAGRRIEELRRFAATPEQ